MWYYDKVFLLIKTMKNFKSEILKLLKSSKGAALLTERQKETFMLLIAYADNKELEKLYKILIQEEKTAAKLEKDFQEKALKTLEDYYSTVKNAVKQAKFKDLGVKQKKSAKEDLAAAGDILSNLKNL